MTEVAEADNCAVGDGEDHRVCAGSTAPGVQAKRRWPGFNVAPEGRPVADQVSTRPAFVCLPMLPLKFSGSPTRTDSSGTWMVGVRYTGATWMVTVMVSLRPLGTEAAKVTE